MPLAMVRRSQGLFQYQPSLFYWCRALLVSVANKVCDWIRSEIRELAPLGSGKDVSRED